MKPGGGDGAVGKGIEEAEDGRGDAEVGRGDTGNRKGKRVQQVAGRGKVGGEGLGFGGNGGEGIGKKKHGLKGSGKYYEECEGGLNGLEGQVGNEGSGETRGRED